MSAYRLILDKLLTNDVGYTSLRTFCSSLTCMSLSPDIEQEIDIGINSYEYKLCNVLNSAKHEILKLKNCNLINFKASPLSFSLFRPIN